MWIKDSKIRLSFEKCKVMHFGWNICRLSGNGGYILGK